MAACLAAAEEEGLFARSLSEVTFASHCPLMDHVLPAFRAALGEVPAGRARIPMLSTVLGRLVDGDRLSADYWLDNLRQPVLSTRRFAAHWTRGGSDSPRSPCIRRSPGAIRTGSTTIASTRRSSRRSGGTRGASRAVAGRG